MATFPANKVRAVGIEVKDKSLDIYTSAAVLAQTVMGWTLNSYDPNLPTPFEVQSALASYKALKVQALKLSEWIAELEQAEFGDTLTYPPPPQAFDGSGTFDGAQTFDPDAGTETGTAASTSTTKILTFAGPEAGAWQELTIDRGLSIDNMNITIFSPDDSVDLEWDLQLNGESLILPDNVPLRLSMDAGGSQQIGQPWNFWFTAPVEMQQDDVLRFDALSFTGRIQVLKVTIWCSTI